MTASSGSSADRRWPWAALALALFLVTGCSSAAEPGAPTPTDRPDEALRKSIGAALQQAGRASEAGTVTRGGTRLTVLPAPFLKSWKVVRVDDMQGPHPVMFHVASQGQYAYLLTGLPGEFTKLAEADGLAVNDPGTAAAVATLFLESTRPTNKPTYLISSPEEIKFRPGISGSAAVRKDEIVARYGPQIKPPAAVKKGKDFVVTAFVVQGPQLQRREVTVTGTGAVTETTKVLAPDLPVPYAL